MANGFLGDIKSRLGFGRSRNEDYDDAYEEYDDYDDYEDGYDDPYMDRNPVTTRGGRSDNGLPRLVSLDDARESVLKAPYGSAGKNHHEPYAKSNGRTMVDSSLPPTMTPEGTAAMSAASNRRQAEGLDSLFAPTSHHCGTTRQSSSFSSHGSAGRSQAGQSAGSSRNSSQLSIPGTRHLQVVKPLKYDDAEQVTSILKAGDVAIIVFDRTPQDLMKRILDFSFGAASALDATVECVDKGVFAIARSVSLDGKERADLQSMGIVRKP